ncbi:uncharacterized protein LOC734618 isoform X1 [Xenopus laevis]|uniref:Uncharacterized protein LOC734618 isoform X1 n=2 Tax=Xenopus laevis TaxID=8355 RepID=A0A1L8FN95_XENLA|nr:uncharacterized protein LOC734618 isoform X1 [Xenopus laevis]XP_041424516.1 uncharacterized protein LOC734618 isoform X1 [Xenopus laevis]OCT73049.1 hypothetical protein XELAEV_18036028mg [Xenopus laevis]
MATKLIQEPPYMPMQVPDQENISTQSCISMQIPTYGPASLPSSEPATMSMPEIVCMPTQGPITLPMEGPDSLSSELPASVPMQVPVSKLTPMPTFMPLQTQTNGDEQMLKSVPEPVSGQLSTDLIQTPPSLSIQLPCQVTTYMSTPTSSKILAEMPTSKNVNTIMQVPVPTNIPSSEPHQVSTSPSPSLPCQETTSMIVEPLPSVQLQVPAEEPTSSSMCVPSQVPVPSQTHNIVIAQEPTSVQLQRSASGSTSVQVTEPIPVATKEPTSVHVETSKSLRSVPMIEPLVTKWRAPPVPVMQMPVLQSAHPALEKENIVLYHTSEMEMPFYHLVMVTQPFPQDLTSNMANIPSTLTSWRQIPYGPVSWTSNIINCFADIKTCLFGSVCPCIMPCCHSTQFDETCFLGF